MSHLVRKYENHDERGERGVSRELDQGATPSRILSPGSSFVLSQVAQAADYS